MNNETLNQNITTPVSKKNIMIPIIIICMLLLITGVYFLYEYLNPKLEINNIKEEYKDNEFSDYKFTLSSSLFIKKEDTLWTLNGYDISKGKELKNIPVKSEKNIITITNKNITKTYEFNVNIESTLLLTDETLTIPTDYQDYDKDGIPNIVEKEKGLSTYTNDTDGDGLYDNVELIMGLDPTKKDDYNEVRTFEVYQDNDESKNNYIKVKGKGNIANTFLDTYEGNIGISSEYILNKEMLRLTTTNKEEEEVTIYIKKNYFLINKEVSIYTYDENTKKIEELSTTCDNKYCSAILKNLDKILFMGDKSLSNIKESKNQIHILLDNSGSMYTKEYVYKKKNIKNTDNSDIDEYANDTGFKRVALMNELIRRLGTKNYEYSASAFTGDYCKLIENSKDSKAIQNKISSIKTECQNFNGTRLTSSIKDEANKFDTKVPGSKFLIVLTDGNDNSLFGVGMDLSKYEINNIAKKGIKIITIGLGSNLKVDNLIEMAKYTNGKYLYASDSNMLETLIGIIEGDIENKQVQIEGEETTLIADSGFDVKRDGFSFKNFGSKDSEGGNCYGFSEISKEIFLNTLKTSDTEKKTNSSYMLGNDYKIPGYSLSENNKKRLKKGNIYSIKLNSKYNEAFNFELSKLSDYRYVKDEVSYINSKYKGQYSSLGFEPYFKEFKKAQTFTINGKNEKVKKYETQGYIDLTGAKNVSKEYKDDYELLQLINIGYRKQYSNFIGAFANSIKHNNKDINYKYYKNLNKLIEEVKTGSPAMISIRCSIAGHSVIGNKVYKVNGKETYIVGIYDSNQPGVEGKAYFERQTSYEKNTKNPYYSFSYTGGGIDFNTFTYQE